MAVEVTNEMLISLSVAFAQFLSAILLTWFLTRHEGSVKTFYTILWLMYDVITHITLVRIYKS